MVANYRGIRIVVDDLYFVNLLFLLLFLLLFSSNFPSAIDGWFIKSYEEVYTCKAVT